MFDTLCSFLDIGEQSVLYGIRFYRKELNDMELLLSVIIVFMIFICTLFLIKRIFRKNPSDFHIHIGLNGLDLSASFYHPLEGDYHKDNE